MILFIWQNMSLQKQLQGPNRSNLLLISMISTNISIEAPRGDSNVSTHDERGRALEVTGHYVALTCVTLPLIYCFTYLQLALSTPGAKSREELSMRSSLNRTTSSSSPATSPPISPTSVKGETTESSPPTASSDTRGAY